MKKYEIMAIIVSDLSEADAQSHIETAITGAIKNFGGKTSFEDFWGVRGFAYKIKQYTHGYYFVAQFELDNDKIAELRRDLTIDTKVLRFLITSVDPKAPAPKKYAEMKKENETLEKPEKKAVEAAEPAAPAKPKNAAEKQLDNVVANAEL